MRLLFFFFYSLFIYSCNHITAHVKTESDSNGGNTPVAEYFNYGDTGVQSAGIRMIPITTPVGNFKVWTKRFGNNPHIKILLLHAIEWLHLLYNGDPVLRYKLNVKPKESTD